MSRNYKLCALLLRITYKISTHIVPLADFYIGRFVELVVTGHQSNRTSKTSNQNPFKRILTTYKNRFKWNLTI